jgi:hypothetical protein
LGIALTQKNAPIQPLNKSAERSVEASDTKPDTL